MKTLSCFFVLFFTISTPAVFKVSIDPGHGGDDQGAVHGGVKESQLAFKIAQKLFRRMKRDKAFRVQLVRHEQAELSLEDRVARAQRFQPDLFLSIHANAEPSGRARGTEFYIQNQLPVDEENRLLAHHEYASKKADAKKHSGDVESILFDLNKSHRILKSYQVSGYLRKNWPSKKRKMIRQGPFYVLSQNEVPAVLVEVGYLTHKKDRAQLVNESYQNQIVSNIHGALVDYAKNMDKLPSPILQPQNGKTR